jgi:hypothetical protein
LTPNGYGQRHDSDETRIYTEEEDIGRMIGKPTFDSTADGLNMKVWIVTQDVNRTMMKGKMSQMMLGIKEPSLRHKLMSGTHHFMLFLKDTTGRMKTSGCIANLRLTSPSMKDWTVNLKNLMRHYANGLALDETGEYLLTVAVTDRGVDRTTRFWYTMK